MVEADDGGNVLQRGVANAIRYPGAAYRLLRAVVIGFFLVAFGFPLYWLLVLSVTPPGAAFGLGLFPETVTPVNFLYLLDPFGRSPFLYYIVNSVVLSAATTVVVLVVATFAGYVFGRLRFPGRRVLMLATLSIAYFPPAAFLVPLFRLFTGNVTLFGLRPPMVYNTAGSVVFPLSALTLPLAIFVLTTFFQQIPDTLEDAARVEGTTRLGALWRVVLPLSGPGLASAAVLTFIQVYNEFFYSYLMNDGQVDNWAPIAPALVNLQETGPTFAAAGSVAALVPVVVLVALASERLVDAIDTSHVR
ncbi:multiple sugar transport system permease protein [Halogranum gelatinilyticum]|uniref:Multiple sugar transport system permease protein n=1 Tax=Halogranum gelatinilyticum TaxID=660521 RepID=A0A1G9SKT6_9EURY|nr:carbohydrate ABC transporter permease [Halogranum gelatinilyticum]SDM35405.1 multiple sugar transport system permease protein [Halogranum gelatinilyticum]